MTYFIIGFFTGLIFWILIFLAFCFGYWFKKDEKERGD